MGVGSWIGGVIIALIGVVSAYLAGRSAKAASKLSADASVLNARTAAETGAYERAREMDLETISIQKERISELRAENDELKKRVRELEISEANLERRVWKLEHQGDK